MSRWLNIAAFISHDAPRTCCAVHIALKRYHRRNSLRDKFRLSRRCVIGNTFTCNRSIQISTKWLLHTAVTSCVAHDKYTAVSFGIYAGTIETRAYFLHIVARPRLTVRSCVRTYARACVRACVSVRERASKHELPTTIAARIIRSLTVNPGRGAAGWRAGWHSSARDS